MTFEEASLHVQMIYHLTQFLQYLQAVLFIKIKQNYQECIVQNSLK
jgi:hypothetical protein